MGSTLFDCDFILCYNFMSVYGRHHYIKNEFILNVISIKIPKLTLKQIHLPIITLNLNFDDTFAPCFTIARFTGWPI